MAGKHRPEVDGLRAVAVVPVLLFHAGIAPFAGGFVGVDVFFVISGYLITTIIHGEIAEGRFSIVRFYERRARRILPALFLVMLVALPFAWAWLLPFDMRDFAQSVVAVNLFSSNILFWKETNYFSPDSDLKPLLHTWSLAVEEQFYVLFPLLLLALRRVSERALLGLLAGLVVASLALAHWGATAAPGATFYLLPARAWELGVGALLALTASRWSHVEGPMAQAGAAAGLALILIPVFVYTEATPFPSLWALAPVLGAAAVIAFARPATVVGRVLSWGPIVGIGLISYSLYLWHQPILAFARRRIYDHALTPLETIPLLLLAGVLAWLSWRYVEQPFRKPGAVSRRQIFAGAAACGVALVAVGGLVHVARGAPGRMPPGVVEMNALSVDYSPYRYTCHTYAGGPRPHVAPEEACLHGAQSGEPINLWGDSHGVELAWRLSEQLRPLGAPVREMTRAACVPLPSRDYAGYYDAGCTVSNAEVFEFLKTADFETPIVLAARWGFLFEREGYDNLEGGVENIPIRPPFALDAEAMGEVLRGTITELLDRGRRVVLVYPLPAVGWDVPKVYMSEKLFHIRRDAPMSTSYERFKAYNKTALEQLDRLPDHPNLIRVRPEALFCDTVLPGRCVAELDGQVLYFDDDHLNRAGADLLAGAVIAAMQERGWLTPEPAEPAVEAELQVDRR